MSAGVNVSITRASAGAVARLVAAAAILLSFVSAAGGCGNKAAANSSAEQAGTASASRPPDAAVREAELIPVGSPSPAASDGGASATLLPDSEPAGAPFPSLMAAAVAEVTQGGPTLSNRVYRVAFDQARKEINQDNAYDRLRALEHEIDLERQALP
jgi:hypothetical protein